MLISVGFVIRVFQLWKGILLYLGMVIKIF